MSKPRNLVHVELIPIRWGDMDAMGHVNNTVYFRYMEQARISWLDDTGCRNVKGEDGHRMGPIVISANCTFLKPFVYPGTVEIKTFLESGGRTSIQMAHELRIVGDDTIYAEGGAKLVWMDYTAAKSFPLPDKLRALCPA
jgi:acyl-CoA thioester hydrolase